jgi:ketosteroid isomerase-like protein
MTGGIILVVAALAAAETNAQLEEQVRQAERGFARSLADRDYARFQTFLADDAVFFGQGGVRKRGKAAVAEGWKPLFEGPKAPLSWEPADVAVVGSGGLAISTGPVYDAEGRRFGTFNSVWRREKDGAWKVVLDKPCPDCDCGKAPVKIQP